MAIFRCSKCGHIREVGADYVGKLVKCPKCDGSATIHDTVVFIRALIKSHLAQSKELKLLREGSPVAESSDNGAGAGVFPDVDINSTSIFTQERSFAPIVDWFEERNIEVQIDPDAVDTTGFFDEIALKMGANFKTLNLVSNQIKYIQNKGYDRVKLDLAKKSSQEIQQITSFCKTMHDYSFVAKYYYKKNDKTIHLTLQTAAKVREFFNGIWMEWFALMKLLELFKDQKQVPSISRGVEVSFSMGKKNELDIFLLTAGKVPVCIECKSGEFRQDIDKYLSLRKKLGIEKRQFVVCVFGLSEEQAQGMTSMYDLTFVNETTLVGHVQSVI